MNMKFLTNNTNRIVGLAIVVVLWYFARQPALSEIEQDELVARFSFEKHNLPEVLGPPQRLVRNVHPDLDHLSAWISSVGAAVAVSDLDGDGLANDICYVDTRTDQVIVTAVPESKESTARYRPFVLKPQGVPFNRQTMAPTGCVPGDLNEDGLLDVLVYYWGRTPIAFLQRSLETPSGALDETVSVQPFEAARFAPCEIGQSGERWFSNAATRADVDGDGHVDLIVGNYFQDQARVLDVAAEDSQELHHSMSRSLNGGTNRLLLFESGTSGSQPTVKFREIAGAWPDEVSHGWTLGAAAADLDGDLLPEIYFANDFGKDRLLHNRSKPGEPHFVVLNGQRSLTTPRSKVMGGDSFKGMGADFGDINGDGHLDIYVSNIAAEWGLQESHFAWINTGQVERMAQGIAPFVDRSETLGLARSSWGWESRLADFDNDGVPEAIQATGFVAGEKNRWPQLHEAAMGNDLMLRHPKAWHRMQLGDDLCGHEHNPFFVRSATGRYYDIAQQVGLGDEQVSRGIATADVDGDGDLDIAVANQWQPSYFYRNTTDRAGEFLALRLLLPLDSLQGLQTIRGHNPINRPTTAAIGAVARVLLKPSQSLIAQVDGGNGHSGVRSTDLHFGLGMRAPSSTDADRKVRVKLRWRGRDGTPQVRHLQLTPGWHTIILGDSNETLSQL